MKLPGFSCSTQNPGTLQVNYRQSSLNQGSALRILDLRSEQNNFPTLFPLLQKDFQDFRNYPVRGILTLMIVPFIRPAGCPSTNTLPPKIKTRSRIPINPSDLGSWSCASLIPMPLSRTVRIKSPSLCTILTLNRLAREWRAILVSISWKMRNKAVARSGGNSGT